MRLYNALLKTGGADGVDDELSSGLKTPTATIFVPSADTCCGETANTASSWDDLDESAAGDGTAMNHSRPETDEDAFDVHVK